MSERRGGEYMHRVHVLTYQGVHVVGLREGGDGVPSKMFDERYPSGIVTGIRGHGAQEERKFGGIWEGGRRGSKGDLYHVPVAHDFGQGFRDLGTGGAQQQRYQIVFLRRVESVKESINRHAGVALKTNVSCYSILGNKFLPGYR